MKSFIDNILKKKKNKKKSWCNPEKMGVNIDKNEFYEITQSNSAHPENINKQNS